MTSSVMLLHRIWRLAACVFLLACLLAASAPAADALARSYLPAQQPDSRVSTAIDSVARPNVLVEPTALLDSREIAWGALLVPIMAASALLWAELLRRQVRAKTRALETLLLSQRADQQFDAARNLVLESIARNSPLPESMERLAVAVEQQVPGSLCAIILPGDEQSQNPDIVPILIAPTLREDLQRSFAAAVASALVCGCNEPLEKTGTPVAATLLQILRNADLGFQAAHTSVLFSTTASMSGMLLLFVGQSSAEQMERAKSTLLPSASRLASLARNSAFMHERLLHEAQHDNLTGLPNRAVAQDRLEQALARAQRNLKGFAIFCIDLDGFKAINDELGHDVGDGVLRVVASRLRARIRHSDTLARMGGDEFWAILEDCSGAAAAQMAAQALTRALEQPVSFSGRNVQVSASIGIAMYPADGDNATQLKRHADQAMYMAKSQGGTQISFWSAEKAPAAGIAEASTPDRPLRKSAKAT